MNLEYQLREYVRRHDLRLAKAAYRRIIKPLYRLAGVPCYDMTVSWSLDYTWFRIPWYAMHSVGDAVTRTQMILHLAGRCLIGCNSRIHMRSNASTST